jgi:hypothetical protein
MPDFAMCYENTKYVFEIARGFLHVVIMDMHAAIVCCLLAIAYWLLAVGCCLLAIVYWLLFNVAIVYWLLLFNVAIVYCLLAIGYAYCLLPIGYWLLAIG